jgi:hypothetical protein
MTKGALIGTAVATAATTNAQAATHLDHAHRGLSLSKQDEWRDCHSNCHRHKSGNAKQITNSGVRGANEPSIHRQASRSFMILGHWDLHQPGRSKTANSCGSAGIACTGISLCPSADIGTDATKRIKAGTRAGVDAESRYGLL